MSETLSPPLTIVEIPVADIVSSPFNPRKTFDEAGLQELAASVTAQGVIEPLVVRPREGKLWSCNTPIHYELIAGERRWRAAQIAGLRTVPCLVRWMSDTAVIEQALTENRQRRDVHPIEEAEAIRQLQALDPMYTVDVLAARLGMSRSWVRARLKLLQLIPLAQEAYRRNAITAGHAELLITVPAEHQVRALTACFASFLFYAALKEREDAQGPDDTAPESVAHALELLEAQPEEMAHLWPMLAACVDSLGTLRNWINEKTIVDLTAPEIQEALPELQDHIDEADATAATAAFVKLSDEFYMHADLVKTLGVLVREKWVEVSEDNRCEHMTTGIIVHPASVRPRILTVCHKPACPVHRPQNVASRPAAPKPDPKQRAEERAEREAAEKAAKHWQDVERPAYLAALRDRVTGFTITKAAMVALRKQFGVVDDAALLVGVKLNPDTAVGVLVVALAMSDLGPMTWEEDLNELGAILGLPIDQWRKANAPASTTKQTKKGGL